MKNKQLDEEYARENFSTVPGEIEFENREEYLEVRIVSNDTVTLEDIPDYFYFAFYNHSNNVLSFVAEKKDIPRPWFKEEEFDI